MHPDWKKIDTIDELIERTLGNVRFGHWTDDETKAARSDLTDLIDRAIEIKRATVAVEMAKRILELEQLLGERDEEIDDLRERAEYYQDRRDELKQQLGEKQAQIDRLMLEFCPEEMTPEQIAEWGKNQKVGDV